MNVTKPRNNEPMLWLILALSLAAYIVCLAAGLATAGWPPFAGAGVATVVAIGAAERLLR